jgi:putative heme-binding domain-containing protein
MLLNIVNPGAEIREGFATTLVAARDGRVFSGVVLEQDSNVVVLRVDDGRPLAIAREEIDEIRASPKSLMPEWLLKGLGDQDVRDLFAYLRSTQPLID